MKLVVKLREAVAAADCAEAAWGLRTARGLSELSKYCMRGNGTKFIVISFKSTLREPSNRMELQRADTKIERMNDRAQGVASTPPC